MPYVFEGASLLDGDCQSPGQSNESKIKEDNEKETRSIEERINSLDMLISGK